MSLERAIVMQGRAERLKDERRPDGVRASAAAIVLLVAVIGVVVLAVEVAVSSRYAARMPFVSGMPTSVLAAFGVARALAVGLVALIAPNEWRSRHQARRCADARSDAERLRREIRAKTGADAASLSPDVDPRGSSR